MNNTKYKEAGNGYFFKIFLDEFGDEISRTPSFNEGKPGNSAVGYYKEMQAWTESGKTIEPQFTSEELAEKEEKETADAIQDTKLLCVLYLNDSEIHVSTDPPYPLDSQKWKYKRAEWRTILKSGVAQDIPEKPFKI